MSIQDFCCGYSITASAKKCGQIMNLPKQTNITSTQLDDSMYRIVLTYTILYTYILYKVVCYTQSRTSYNLPKVSAN